MMGCSMAPPQWPGESSYFKNDCRLVAAWLSPIPREDLSHRYNTAAVYQFEYIQLVPPGLEYDDINKWAIGLYAGNIDVFAKRRGRKIDRAMLDRYVIAIFNIENICGPFDEAFIQYESNSMMNSLMALTEDFEQTWSQTIEDALFNENVCDRSDEVVDFWVESAIDRYHRYNEVDEGLEWVYEALNREPSGMEDIPSYNEIMDAYDHVSPAARKVSLVWTTDNSFNHCWSRYRREGWEDQVRELRQLLSHIRTPDDLASPYYTGGVPLDIRERRCLFRTDEESLGQVVSATVDAVRDHGREIAKVTEAVAGDVAREMGHENISGLLLSSARDAMKRMKIDRALEWIKGVPVGRLFAPKTETKMLPWREKK